MVSTPKLAAMSMPPVKDAAQKHLAFSCSIGFYALLDMYVPPVESTELWVFPQ
jgi:hypothetical protein